VGVGYGHAPEGRVCCWGGMGDSLVIIDVDRRMTFAYMMNKMDGEVRVGSPRAEAYLRAVYAALDVTLPT
jgi:CubicO group peptidase (beta-lactamase class C family)